MSFQMILWELIVLFSFAVFLSHVCSLNMMLDEVLSSRVHCSSWA
jgi:hypothetical protein